MSVDSNLTLYGTSVAVVSLALLRYDFRVSLRAVSGLSGCRRLFVCQAVTRCRLPETDVCVRAQQLDGNTRRTYSL